MRTKHIDLAMALFCLTIFGGAVLMHMRSLALPAHWVP